MNRAFRCASGFGLSLLVLACEWPSTAQPIITAPRPASTNQPDPLAAFMVSQPPIDTTSPITPAAEFEPNIVTNGQEAVYRVTLNVMEQSVEWPDSIPTPKNCTIRRGASGQFLQNLGGSIVPQTTFLYHVQPRSNGTVLLPSYKVRARGEAVQIPPATLTVVPPGLMPVETAPRIQLVADGTEFFVGQDVDVQATFQGTRDGTVRTLSQVEVLGEGIIVDRNYRAQRVEMRTENGVARPTFIYNASVTPLRPGQTELTARGYTFGSRVSAPIVISGSVRLPSGPPTYKLVDSDPLTIHVLPLPHAKELPGFTGAIGSFTLDPPVLSTNRVRAGDLLTLSLTLHGTGNLERVLPPTIEAPPQWQVFQPEKEETLAAIVRQRRFVRFEYQLIPLDDSIHVTPPIPFCYFDPHSRAYVDLSVPPQPITVKPSPSPPPATGRTSLVEVRSFLRELLKKSKEPTALADTLDSRGRSVSDLEPAHQQVWFYAVQLLPATLLGGLWYWDRRRRFFEQYPDVLIRRRARRAVRRHARHARNAARNTDARSFLHHAIQGFREACAPTAPADPRALVCGDILTTLPSHLRHDQTVSVVAKLFTAANDWRFGDAPPAGAELLQLAEEVDHRLEELRHTL